MSQESISFFEDKTAEQIINWMIAHLSESQLRACLDSAGISPGYSAGPSSLAGPSSSTDPLPIPTFTPPIGSFDKPKRVRFDKNPFVDKNIGIRPINPVSQDMLTNLIKYVGFQIETKDQINKAFPALKEAGLSAIPVYIYDYEAPNVYFLGFETNPAGMFVVPFVAPTLEIFKRIGFELLASLNDDWVGGIYTLPPGRKIVQELNRTAKIYTDMKDSTQDINKNIREILTTPNYLDTVKRTMIEIKEKLAAKKAAKFGFTENYNGGLDLFDDLTVDSFENEYEYEYKNKNNFGAEYENDYENKYENNYENEFGTENGTETESNLGTETESNLGTENENENENENEMSFSKMRVYDMNPEQRKEYMTNKFGAKFAHEFRAESYINSKGIPAVKYIRTGEIYNESNNGQPIISGFGEEEEENLF